MGFRYSGKMYVKFIDWLSCVRATSNKARDRDNEILLKVKIQSKLNSHRQSVFVKTGSGLMLWYLER